MGILIIATNINKDTNEIFKFKIIICINHMFYHFDNLTFSNFLWFKTTYRLYIRVELLCCIIDILFIIFFDVEKKYISF